jgi:protoheme IX farnesyltransferase
LNSYYELTKPGIIYGNALTAAAGFFFASAGIISWPLLVFMLVGLSLIIASACAINNYLDRDIDALMERTKNRPIPSGAISPNRALWFGIMLGLVGSLVLFFHANLLTLGAALFGWIVYVFVYSPLKRRSTFALYVGAIAGAMPPLVGYAAVTNALDSPALLLFAFLFLWQIPHFLAIAVYRYDEYTAAGIPLLVSRPKDTTARHQARIVFYVSLVVLLVWCAALTFAPLTV